MEIELKYNRSDFEEIYFSNNSGSYLKSDFTRKPFFHLIISLIILTLFIIFYNGFFAPVIFGIFFIYYLIWYLINARKVYLRRKNVKEYLDKLDGQSKRKLIINDDCFHLEIDNQTYSENWGDIITKEINELYLFMASDEESYLIPRKSISDSDWLILIRKIEK